jgi:hypothetical protein
MENSGIPTLAFTLSEMKTNGWFFGDEKDYYLMEYYDDILKSSQKSQAHRGTMGRARH